MNIRDKTSQKLQQEFKDLQQKFIYLNEIKNIGDAKRKQLEQELSIALQEIDFQNIEKEKRAAELIIANLELTFQNKEKVKRAAELVIANIELVFQNKEKARRAAELIIANKELSFQNDEKEKRADELVIANKELVFQNQEKGKRAAELIIANKELKFESEEKVKRAAELSIAKFLNEEKQKHADEILLVNKELLITNTTKDKFFSIIAHDLKSPFNSIIGFSNLLQEQIGEKNYDGIEKYAGIIEQSSKRSIDLLKNLMEWSQSQTGSMKFNPEFFELVELIKDVERLLIGAAEQKSIKILKTLPSNAPIFADKYMINTVLRNLISNAIKFTHTGGEIIISTNENQGELAVSVSDNGVGISKSNLQKIFRIDGNYSTSGTNKEKGTGLGLILCKEFIEKHEGKIWVESEEGKGSTFYFSLPIAVK